MNHIIKLAIADDHTLFRKGIISILNNYKQFEVIIDAKNGEELLNKISNSTYTVDICLIDIEMAPLNGYETVKILRERYPEIISVGISMHNSEFSSISMLRSGATGFIDKYTEPDKFVHILENIYKNGFHTDSLNKDVLLKAIQNSVVSISELNNVELSIIKLCCSDMTYKEISNMMYMSLRAFENHRNKLFKKLNIKTRSGLVKFVFSNGIYSTG